MSPLKTSLLQVVLACRTALASAEAAYGQVLLVEPDPSPPPPPPPAPAPEPPPLAEFAVEALGTDASSPPTTAGQVVNLSLHGSSTSTAAVSQGDRYLARLAGPLAFDDRNTEFRFTITKGGTNLVNIKPLDRQERGTSARMESHWSGWTHGDANEFVPFTERRLDAMLDWIDAAYPHLSRTKRVVSGGSMGAWGAMSYGMRRPHRFAAIFASRPRLRYGYSTGEVSVPDWESPGAKNYKVAVAPRMVGSSATVAQHLDMIAYVSDHANEIPWLGWCVGRADGYMPWRDHLDMVAALRAAGRPFAFAWNGGDHSSGDIMSRLHASYGYGMFEIGRGVPLITNSSRDQDPAVDVEGGINLGFAWRDVTETADSWSCELSNVLGDTTCMVRPHSRVFRHAVEAQAITIPAGQWVRVSFAAVAEPPASPPPAPAPEPSPPPPAPAPEPPPPEPSPARPLDLVRRINGPWIYFHDWCTPTRYLRWVRKTHFKLAQGTGTLRINGIASGGALRPLAATQYVLRISDPFGAVEHEFTQPVLPAGATNFNATFPLADIAEGWHVVDIVPVGANPTNEAAVLWVFYMQRGAEPVDQPWIPMVQSSYTFVMGSPVSRVLWQRAEFNPAAVPFAPRETPPMPVMPKRSQLIMRDLVVHRGADLHRPHVLDGVWNSFNDQLYFFSHSNAALVNRIPGHAQLDGPRGVGSVAMATHLQFGRDGGLYFCEGTRVGHISPAGHVRTIAGLRTVTSNGRPTFGRRDDMQGWELVGDWSAVPESRRGFHELWGLCFDERTLVADGPEVVNDITGVREASHTQLPTMYVADTQRNRICSIRPSSLTAHGPYVVEEFLTSLSDPWDVAAHDGKLYVTERGANRIVEYDIDTRQLLRVIVQGAAIAMVDPQTRVVKPIGATMDMLRAQPCVGPEGLVYQDGHLTWGALIQKQVRRVNLETLAVEVVRTYDSQWEINANAKFVKICLSDGTFGPRGYPFAATWANSNYGFPIGLDTGSGTANPYGPGKPVNRSDYGAAAACANGKLASASMGEGISIFSKPLPGDPIVTATVVEQQPDGTKVTRPHPYLRGRAEWSEKGYFYSHGPAGYGYHSDPLPWGESADMDAYLTIEGHQRGVPG